MAEESKISWTHGTFNPWWGCTKVSPGCDACYAERDSARFAPGLWGKQAPRRFFGDKHWNEPLRWNAKASKSGAPFRVFCASMADVFEDRRDLDAPRERLWELIERTPALTWLVLTKRPELMTRFAPTRWAQAWPPNVWAMTTVEDQTFADKRIPELLKVPAAVRGLSVEPMTGPVVLRPAWIEAELQAFGPRGVKMFPRIDWVIAGGESGPTSRPVHPQWLRDLRDQCAAAAVAYHIKQWGEWKPIDQMEAGEMDAKHMRYGVDSDGNPDPYKLLGCKYDQTRVQLDGGQKNEWPAGTMGMVRVGKKAAGRALDGKIWDEYPAGQRRRE